MTVPESSLPTPPLAGIRSSLARHVEALEGEGLTWSVTGPLSNDNSDTGLALEAALSEAESRIASLTRELESTKKSLALYQSKSSHREAYYDESW